ncbi:hypothetical protein VTJ83DRAFT_1405 [Remersonia thermophila]|uniref:Uncharacterized protein n=1 Tax=Remersonia thermophila TaxID=72144 RepID=A0ABR4DNZ2_9PEZI
MISGVECFKTELGRLRLALETFSEEADQAMADLELSAAEILARDSDLSRKIWRLYPDVEAGRGSSARRDTNQPAMAASRQDRGIVYLDDAEDSDASSEPGPPTPTSSMSASSTSSLSRLSIRLFSARQPQPRLQVDTATPRHVYRNASQTLGDIIDPRDLLVPIPQRLITNAVAARSALPAGEVSTVQQILAEGISALKLVTISPTGVDVSPLPPDLSAAPPSFSCPAYPDPIPASLVPNASPNATAPLAAESIFHLPDMAESDILSFFCRAVGVSRFAGELRVWAGRGEHGRGIHHHHHHHHHHHRHHQEKPEQHQLEAHRVRLRNLSPKQLRDLCSDLYDALVARNLEDQRRSRPDRPATVLPAGWRKRAGVIVELVAPRRPPPPEPAPEEVERFGLERAMGRYKMRELGDGVFAWFLDSAMAELARRAGER